DCPRVAPRSARLRGCWTFVGEQEAKRATQRNEWFHAVPQFGRPRRVGSSSSRCPKPGNNPDLRRGEIRPAPFRRAGIFRIESPARGEPKRERRAQTPPRQESVLGRPSAAPATTGVG